MRIIIPLLFIAISSISYTQTSTVVGKVISPSDTSILWNAMVYFNDSNAASSDNSGQFSLTIDQSRLTDTLKISYVGFRRLHILNFPNDNDTIDLGEIPMFYGNQINPIVEFFCGKLDFRCKRKEKMFHKRVAKENQEYFSIVNQEIEDYRYSFNDTQYRLEYNTNHSKLTLVIDLLKPDRR